MKFGIISGSNRKNSQSFKVADYIQNLAKQQSTESYLLDLSKVNIKYWDEGFWADSKTFDLEWTKASTELHSCDGIIIVAPEWNGMLPPALVNIMHLAVKGEFANKPVLIVSVSSGINGAYPVVHLHQSGKNSFANFIPHHVIVRDVNNVLNDYSTVANEIDQSIRERLNHALQVLNVYSEAFKQIRSSDVIKNVPYAYGM